MWKIIGVDKYYSDIVQFYRINFEKINHPSKAYSVPVGKEVYDRAPCYTEHIALRILRRNVNGTE